MVKNPHANAGDAGLINESGKPHGEGQPTPFSCLGNPRTEEPGGLQFMTLQRAGHKQHKLFWVLFHGHMLN